MHAFWNNINLKPPRARTKFHDFAMIIQFFFFNFHDFSMHVFLCAIFQVFHDFQSLWEPWFLLIKQSNIGSFGRRGFWNISADEKADHFCDWSFCWKSFWLTYKKDMFGVLIPQWFFYVFCRPLIFFKINFFEKNISGIPSECQSDWILIRPDILSGQIWVQSVCKGYEQTALVGNELILTPPLFYVCPKNVFFTFAAYIFWAHFRLEFFMEASNMNPHQTPYLFPTRE